MIVINGLARNLAPSLTVTAVISDQKYNQFGSAAVLGHLSSNIKTFSHASNDFLSLFSVLTSC